MIRAFRQRVKYPLTIALVFLLSLLLILAVTDPVRADSVETVIIGDGSTEIYELPYANDWNYSRTQIIYKAEDIGRDGSILSVAYDVAVPDASFRIRNLKIWMAHTDLEEFDYDKMRGVKNTEETFGEDELTLVYSGAPQLGSSTGWEKIDLDDPFEYEREQGNLVIVAGLKTEGGSNNLKYSCTVFGANGSVVDRNKVTAFYAGDQNDSSIADLSYDGTNTWKYRSVRPNIQFEIDPSGGETVRSYDVSFDADGGEPVPQTQTVERGGKVAEPVIPVREGYRFNGWFKGDRKYDFDSKVNSSFTLKAEWIKLHTITFAGWNNEVLQTSEVEEGQRPEYSGNTPERPSEGTVEYIFAGWDPVIREADGDQTYSAVFLDKSELADKSELQAAVRKATDARTGIRTSADGSDVGKNFRYVSETQWQAYDEALRTAQAIVDDPYASQSDVDQMLTDLEIARNEFVAAQQYGTKVPPTITDIVISKNSGRQQPAAGGVYEWKVTFIEGTDLGRLAEGMITDDDFQIQRKPSGQSWKNSKCPYVSFSPSDAEGEKNIGYLTGMAIPDNVKESDTTNLWRFIYSGDSVDCPVITQDGYSSVDKSVLRDTIDDAKSAQIGVKVSADGWDVDPTELFVTPEEKQAHDEAIARAQSVESDDRVSQVQVDNAAEELASATEIFIKAKKGGNGEDEPGGLLPGDYRLIYETQKVRMPDIPVREYVDGNEGEDAVYEWYTGRPLRFEFYDSTAQRDGGVYNTKEGTYSDDEGRSHQVQMLSGVELIRGHSYIVSVHERDYMIPLYYRVTIADDGEGASTSYIANIANYYIRLSEDGTQPTDIKNDESLTYIDVRKRDTELSEEADSKRVNVRIPVYYTQDGTSSTILYAVADATIKLTSPEETLFLTSDEKGEINAALIEDVNYMVQLVDDSGALGLSPFPLVVKDHAENGWPKSIYNHFSCGSVQGLYLVDKAGEHSRDTKLISISGKTEVTGQNFQNTSETNADRYFINDRQLDNNLVKLSEGRDYEVFIVDAINMFRTERSVLAAGGYTISRKVPVGKTVENVCYINKQGKLKTLKFTQTNGKVEFRMSTLSMYPNVIIYKSAAPSGKSAAPAVKSAATIKSGTVNATAVKKAIKSSGGKATTLVLGKGVRKISKNALKGTKIKTIIVKTKKLKKKSVKGALKGSKVKTVKVNIGSKKINKKYVKKYKKIFTKKNTGRKVKVKR